MDSSSARVACGKWCDVLLHCTGMKGSVPSCWEGWEMFPAVSPVWELLQLKETDSPKVTPLPGLILKPVTDSMGAYGPWSSPLGSTLECCHELTKAAGSLASGSISLSAQSAFFLPLMLFSIFLWKAGLVQHFLGIATHTAEERKSRLRVGAWNYWGHILFSCKGQVWTLKNWEN